VLLGVIAERVGRKPLAQAMQDRLFRRFQMRHTSLPAAAVNAIPEPYSHGYLYGSSSMALIGGQYAPEVKEAARAGTLLPNDYTNVNHSFAGGAGGVISTASDVANWIQALVTGKVLNAQYHRRWMNSFKPVDPSKPNGQQYGYGIDRLSWGPNAIYFHGGETAGFNSFIGHDPNSHMTLIVWTNLTLSLEASQTANALMLKVLDQIYVLSPLAPPPTSENAQ
jgi:D-alanyl-D-alanine carboxypeptidase